jgi:uncharacterized protein (TIGR01319 family)
VAGTLPRWVLCADFGSTFTKLALVDTEQGLLLGTAQRPTSLATDVLDGYEAARAELLAAHQEVAEAHPLACSSAGGGLRIAVVGNEELVTAEAGRRVALSSGGKVVTVLAGGLDDARRTELEAACPDVVLLVGGTDGGNSAQLLADAGSLARAGWTGPVVVAGDVHAREEVASLLGAAGTPYLLADNVVPRIGVLEPSSARLAIREVFLSHVIGGKNLSRRPELAQMVLGATPDVVLTGVELLAEAYGSTRPGSGVVVLDVGGATTDVHSVVLLDPEEASLAREVVAVSPVTRTVEGDLGLRWSAVTTADAALDAGLVEPDLLGIAEQRAADPAYVATGAVDLVADLRLAGAAAVLAMRRHVGRSKVVLSDEGRIVERSGKDLRAVGLLVASGGVFRAATAEAARVALLPATGHDLEGWQYPEQPRIVVDTASVLAAAGLIALHGGDADAAAAARSLICNTVSGVSDEGSGT